MTTGISKPNIAAKIQFPNPNLMVVKSGGQIVIEAGGSLVDKSVGAGVAGTGVTVNEISSPVKTVVLTINATVAMTDHTTAGAQGSADLFTFPAGNILVLGAVTDLTLTAGVGGVADTAAVVASLGSVALGIGDATLTGTEADIVPSTACTMTAGIGAMNGQSTSPATLDGTSSAAKCRLNIAVPDAGTSANDTIVAVGTVTLSYVNLGDN